MRAWLWCVVLAVGCAGREPASTAQPAGQAGAVGVAGTLAATGAAAGSSAGAAGRAPGTTPPPPAANAGTAAPRDAGQPMPDAAPPADDAGTEPPPPSDAGTPPVQSMPGTIKVFDRIPQFGMYRSDEPRFTPPQGVLMWERGTLFVTKLSRMQQAQIGADLKARVTYHAQCDNYDRIGGAFLIVVPPGEKPTPTSQRIELVRFITPFSDYNRGSLATYAFPLADLAPFAVTLADPSHDVWIGIGGGSNPYDGDPCTNTNQPADFKEIGFLYSFELVSTMPLTSRPSSVLGALYNVSAMRVPVEAMLDAPAALSGKLNVIVSGHGAESGGNEYMHTQDRVSVNGKEIGAFGTQIDCASYAKFSPDGNQGIFRNNTSSNPRNWCPGALVAPHSFDVTLQAGKNAVKLDIDPTSVPQGSFYATSISFTAP